MKRIPLPQPPLVAAWLAGRDRDLLAPLSFVAGAAPQLPAGRAAAREQLAPALERANRSYGHGRAAELAARLADPAARVVISGQQPGLFGGPLYTLHKMIATVLWAERLSAAGTPAVPLFWVATEDHDYQEVAEAAVWASDGLRRVALGDDPDPLMPVGMRTLGAPVAGLLGELAELFPYSPYREWTERMARWYRPDARFGEAFCRLAIDLLGERAPLLVDALLPELKAAERPWLETLVRRRSEVADALAAAESEISGRGYLLQVAPQPDAAPLFLLDGAERRRILWLDGDRFTLRGADSARPVEELQAIVAENPSAVAPNVLSRPVVQDAVFGTTLQVLGPGELSYFAQAAPLWALLDVPAPGIVLRPQAVLLDAKQEAALDSTGAPAEALFEPEEALDRRLAAGQAAGFVAPALEEVRTVLDALREPTVALDPNLERPWEKTRDHVVGALEKLGEKVTRAAAHQDEIGRRRLDALRAYCAPGGVPHERVLAGAHFRGRFGPDLVPQLFAQLDLEPGDLQLLTLEAGE